MRRESSAALTDLDAIREDTRVASGPYARVRVVRLSMPDLWAFLAVDLPMLGALLASLSTVDLAYHVRAGQVILDTRAFPSPDTFTFTAAGLPWVDQQWLAQLGFATLYDLGGWALMSVARAFLVGLISWLVYRGCRAAGADQRVAAWLTLGGFAVGLVALAMRPQLLGMVLFAATVAVLAGRQQRPRIVWLVPLFVVAWTNIHGSFFLGPVAVFVAWLEDIAANRPRPYRLLAVAIACALATIVNPFGPAVWTYAAGVAGDPLIRQLVSEWQATSALSFTGLLFYGSVVAGLLLVWVSSRGVEGGARVFIRMRWPTLLWLAGLAVLGAMTQRGVAWWAVGAPVAIATILWPRAGRVGDTWVHRSLANTAVAAGVVVAIVALLPTWRGGDVLYGPKGLLTDAPQALTDAVRGIARTQDRIWNAQRWGSWLEFATPMAPVAVDSRIELIPQDAWRDHLALSRGDPEWAAILERRGVTIVVASKAEQAPLIPLLREAAGWNVVAEDPDGVVFARANGGRASLDW